MVTFIVDDQDEDVQYLCPVSKQTVSGSYYNNTWTSVTSASCFSGWFRYTFSGTAVNIVASASRTNLTTTVKIDNWPWTSQVSNGRYQSPILKDGQHTITYGVGNPELFPALDYITVTAGPSSFLQDRTIAVDDSDWAVLYHGNWTTEPPMPLALHYSSSLYHNTAHWTTTAGSTMQFQFFGNSVSLFGVYMNTTLGKNVTISYTLDDEKAVTVTTPRRTLPGMPMTLLFHEDTLATGNHTLFMNVTNMPPKHAIGLDFITYNASVADLKSIPGYVPMASYSFASPGSVAGEIAGGVIGGLVGTAAIVALCLVLWKRWKRPLGSRRDSRPPREKTWIELKT